MSGANSKKLASKENVPTRYFRDIDVKKLLLLLISGNRKVFRVLKGAKEEQVFSGQNPESICWRKYFMVKILKVFVGGGANYLTKYLSAVGELLDQVFVGGGRNT